MAGVMVMFVALLSPTYRPRPWGPHRTPPFTISKGPAVAQSESQLGGAYPVSTSQKLWGSAAVCVETFTLPYLTLAVSMIERVQNDGQGKKVYLSQMFSLHGRLECIKVRL